MKQILQCNPHGKQQSACFSSSDEIRNSWGFTSFVLCRTSLYSVFSVYRCSCSVDMPNITIQQLEDKLKLIEEAKKSFLLMANMMNCLPR